MAQSVKTASTIVVLAFLFGSSHSLDAGEPGTPPTGQNLRLPPDLVAGNLIQFNDNGNWTWYCDERSVVDKSRGKLIVGSDASGAGMGGSTRSGDVQVVIFNFSTGAWQRFTLKEGASDPGAFYSDDHNVPGLLVRPDGKYLAWYSAHNTQKRSYWRNWDGTNWSAEQVFDWTTIPGGTDFNATYSNPHYLSAEGRTYNFVRGNDHGSPNILVSLDRGDTWSFGGQLVATLTNVGYVSGYFKYSGNGIDRIDFIATESHPRDTSTSMYHGYISNGMSFRSDGTLVDSNIFDQLAPTVVQFTKIFTNGTVWPPGQTNYRCWNDDVQTYPDGTVQAIIATRINNDIRGNDTAINPNHAFFFCRHDRTNWSSTYLCQAGTKLYASEADYIGLGSLSPDDPNTIFISTRYDPRAVRYGELDTNQPFSNVREIWKGVTTNRGASFAWSPITQNSTRDNLRPIVPAWDRNNSALLWFRAAYNSAHSIDGVPVGLLERHAEARGTMSYVDANTSNTTLATGAPLVTGAGTGQWHLNSGNGNGGDVLASAETVAEDAPALKTTVTAPEPGTYDLWVNFWGNPLGNADWRIVAGTATNQMQVFRQMACRTVQPGEHDTRLVLTNSNTNYLYQAYVGRVPASISNTLSVFVDDRSIAAGTTGPLVGDNLRTWYDGISYAKVTPFHTDGHWVTTWGCGLQLTEPGNLPPVPMSNSTLRQFVRTTIGGKHLRVRFSNAYGTNPVSINAARIALSAGAGSAGDGDINTATDKALAFRGASGAVIPPGEVALSDPIDFDLPALTNVAISIFFGNISAKTINGHPGSRTTSFIVASNAVSAASMPGASKTAHWYIITGIDVLAGASSRALLTLGDSITDGRGSTTDGNDRWPDNLAIRLITNVPTAGVAVVNMGIGGNAIFGGLGPAAVNRFDRDALSQSSVGWVIVFEGVNDIGGVSDAGAPALTTNLINAYTQFANKTHARGVRVYGATITPFGGHKYYTTAREAARQTVNAWFRTNTIYDGVIDFDAVVRDPMTLTNLLPAYDTGDHLHLNPAGYRAMADAIDLNLFTP
jgi:lysophospholipase L1-like esterase